MPGGKQSWSMRQSVSKSEGWKSRMVKGTRAIVVRRPQDGLV